MKAAYSLDQTVNINNVPDAWRSQCKPIIGDDGEVADWIIPKGAVVEGDEAVLRVKTGQASPLDEECAIACGMNPAQVSANNRQYLAGQLGIRGEKDWNLFMGGVIDGYAPGSTDEKTIYIPGENYQAWLEAKAEKEKTKGPI